MSDRRQKAWRLIVIASVAALLVSGCTGEDPSPSPSPTPGPPEATVAAPLPVENQYGPTPVPLPPDEPVPAFTGPYASQFDELYRASKSDLQRRVLADGRVTDAEIAALRDAYRACMVSAGVFDVTFDADGSMLVKPPEDWSDDRVQTLVSGCEPTTIGDVDLLYNNTRKNPTNPDSAAVTAECLVRVGLAPAGYSRDDYVRDSPASYPFDTNDERFQQCAQDPANAGR